MSEAQNQPSNVPAQEAAKEQKKPTGFRVEEEKRI